MSARSAPLHGRSSEQQKHRRKVAGQRCLRCTPFSNAESACEARCQREATAHAKPGGRVQCREQAVQQGLISVRRFDHQLRVAFAARLLLQFTNALGARVGFDRQVADKRKTLAVQATRGKGEQQ